jgi:hypothetical protein
MLSILPLTNCSPESAPYCGYFAFVFGVDYTFWNFGCSTSAYKLFVDLLPSTTEGGSSPVILAGGGTSQITPVATTVYVTQQPSGAGGTATVLVAPGATQNGAQTSSTILPAAIKTSTPIGAIVGGVLGGIALIAFLSFLFWFYLRKRRKDKAFALAATQNQQQADVATAAAFRNQTRITEIGGSPKPAGAYIQPPSPRTGVFPEKPLDGNQSAFVVNAHLGSQSPPPSYPQSPQSNSSIPDPSNYSELEEQRRAGGRTPTSPLSWQTGQRSEQEASELGGTNRGSWNIPPGVQEMSASTGGINRRPVGGVRAGPGQYVDMSGAPMSEELE